MILPWQVDVPQDDRPVGNWLIVLACVAVFVLQMVEVTQQVVGGQATVHEATAEPKPAEPERLSVPMLDLNDGRTIPETSAGLRCLCGEWITVSKRYAGKVVRCPRCKASVQIPGDVASDSTDRPRPKTVRAKTKPEAEMIRFACPCGQKIRIPARYGGRRGKCPHCGARLRIPLSTRRSH